MATCRNQAGVFKSFYRSQYNDTRLPIANCICQQQMSRKRQQETLKSNLSRRMRGQCCISTARNLLARSENKIILNIAPVSCLSTFCWLRNRDSGTADVYCAGWCCVSTLLQTQNLMTLKD